MNFNDSFDVVFEKNRLKDIQRGVEFKVSADSTKILMFMWNMIAEANNKLDDIVYLDEDYDIVSFPIEKKAKESGAKKTAKPKDKAVIDEQKEEPETTE